MRRLLSALLASSLLLTLIPAASAETASYPFGDVDRSGSVTSSDLTALARHTARITSLPRKFYAQTDGGSLYHIADVDCNGAEGASDLTALARAVGSISPLRTDAHIYAGVPQAWADALVSENAYAQEAHTAVTRMISDYYDMNTHQLHSERNGSGDVFVWSFGAYLEAVADTLELFPSDNTVRAAYVDALSNGLNKYRVTGSLTTPAGTFSNIVYYNASAYNSGDYYYDDNAWICLQYIRAYDLLGDSAYLTRAEELLRFFETGIDDVLGGGVYWDKSFSSKNTCSDGPIAIAFLQAYQRTSNSHYLTVARDIVDWMNENLREKDNLYIDNIGTNGDRNGWKADYNQGTPLYALSLLAEITGETSYRELADATAAAAMENAFTHPEGADYATIKGNPIYKAWCVGWLMRGFEAYAAYTGDDADAFFCMEYVLDQKTVGKADANGNYDPYFGSGDWDGENKTEVLQTSGVCSVLTVCAHYDVYVK